MYFPSGAMTVETKVSTVSPSTSMKAAGVVVAAGAGDSVATGVGDGVGDAVGSTVATGVGDGDVVAATVARVRVLVCVAAGVYFSAVELLLQPAIRTDNMTRITIEWVMFFQNLFMILLPFFLSAALAVTRLSMNALPCSSSGVKHSGQIWAICLLIIALHPGQ